MANKSKVVFITGADRGLGMMFAREFSKMGCSVFVTGLDEKALSALAEELCSPAAWAVADVRDLEQLRSAMAQAAELFLGSIDVVVANAGIARQVAVEDPEFVDELQLTLNINAVGAANTVAAALPYLKKSRGYALFISSLAGKVNPPLMGAYNASKAAVRAVADTLRTEARPHGIAVGVATFSELDTDMTTKGFGTNAAKYLLEWHGRRILPVADAEPAVRMVARAIQHRRRNVDFPRRARLLRLFPWVAQYAVELWVRPRMSRGLQLALSETAERTTALPPSP